MKKRKTLKDRVSELETELGRHRSLWEKVAALKGESCECPKCGDSMISHYMGVSDIDIKDLVAEAIGKPEVIKYCLCGHAPHDGECPMGQTDNSTGFKTVKCGCEGYEPA